MADKYRTPAFASTFVSSFVRTMEDEKTTVDEKASVFAHSSYDGQVGGQAENRIKAFFQHCPFWSVAQFIKHYGKRIISLFR